MQQVIVKNLFYKFDKFNKIYVLCGLFFKNALNSFKMSRVCQITGKKVVVGNNVSHSKRRTKRTFKPNLFDKKFFLSEENRWIKLKVSAKGIRIINKIGLQKALAAARNKGYIQNI
jgi:large subunit ribosomal protein L28